MPGVAREGDTGSHPGMIVSASEDVITNGRGTARVGDIFACALHGPVPILTGSSDVLTNGRETAHIGSVCACGAVILTGSDDTFVNESPEPEESDAEGDEDVETGPEGEPEGEDLAGTLELD